MTIGEALIEYNIDIKKINDICSSREKMINFLMGGADQVLNKQEFFDAKKRLEDWSDEKLAEYVIGITIQFAKEGDVRKQDFVKACNEKARDLSLPKDEYYRELSAKITEMYERKHFLNYIKKHDASDKVYLTREEDMTLWNLVKDKTSNNTPSDIIFANTIPVLDILIECDERDCVFNGSKGLLNKYRVIIFNDKVKELSSKKILDATCVGILVITLPMSVNLYVPIYVMNGYDFISCSDYWTDKDIHFSVTNEMLFDMFNEYMSTWYAIQISLLNPKIKVVYDNPLKVPLKHSQNGQNFKRKVKYLKVYKLKKEDIEKIIFDDHKSINRKCLCWYVIGHWREYKNGNKIFIQGYWKGALRNTKKNYDEIRERMIDIDGH